MARLLMQTVTVKQKGKMGATPEEHGDVAEDAVKSLGKG